MAVFAGCVAVLMSGAATIACYFAMCVSFGEAITRQAWSYRIAYAAVALASLVGVYAFLRGVLECVDLILPR